MVFVYSEATKEEKAKWRSKNTRNMAAFSIIMAILLIYILSYMKIYDSAPILRLLYPIAIGVVCLLMVKFIIACYNFLYYSPELAKSLKDRLQPYYVYWIKITFACAGLSSIAASFDDLYNHYYK